MNFFDFLAYIDPVSGSLLLQAALAGIVGCFAFFRRSLRTFASRVFGRKKADEKSAD